MIQAISLLLYVAASAQEISWIRQFGTAYEDAAGQVAVANDGSVYAVGWTFGQGSYIRKYDSAGVEQWRKQLQASVIYSVASAISAAKIAMRIAPHRGYG